ncbi:uncharacterized protein LOC127126386 isoform X2 [Lathyrus oleraceus]|uniref:Uncharacterized protein n=1 Tax=Pisum sativum TaxID=3888 RepID=A0A9D4XU80_PEA|nr:uncharacterized protein LOC127126386 isoform X2 [Pisum sativum]KAI5427184.1 hypothetical protein KIW84_032560 [Pisum sativum]
MAPKRNHSSIFIGNCEVTVEASTFTCNSSSNDLLISLPQSGKIKVSAVQDVSANRRNTAESFRSEKSEHEFMLLNPKDVDDISKSYLQEVLQMYMTELPGMNYAANTGKQSKFLERCVTNGKYRTLLLKSSLARDLGKVIAAITYQIIPADTEYAEIPLAAVNAIYQRKGFCHLLFLELKKRLQNVGIRSIFCWGDKESEGFWLKQGFSSIAEVDTRGRAPRLPIKADIRKTLCLPGGSTLMVCHLKKELIDDDANSGKRLLSLPHRNSSTPAIIENEQCEVSDELLIDFISSLRRDTAQSKPKALAKDGSSWGHGKLSGHNPKNCCNDTVPSNTTNCSQSTKVKKRAWEASLSSLKSKRVKGSQLIDCQSDSCYVEASHGDTLITKKSEKCIGDHMYFEAPINLKSPSTKQCFRIMLMNINDDAKKTQLAKVIEDLGGTVAADGSTATHVVTGKVRKTLNFCTALCSGAWVVSSSWLKESFRAGRFVDESPHILNDEDYLLKYRLDLRSAVFRAKACPRALFKGYNICIAANVQSPAETLSAIVSSAGGNVISGLEKVNEISTTIFVTCEEDIKEAMMASKKGIRTFSSEWFMNCVMRQELDLEAPQFVESL